jgi:hypothetical protein
MGQQEDERGPVAQIAERILTSLNPVLDEEREWASREGVPARTYLQGTLNALLEIAAFTACNLIAAESDPTNEAVRARSSRVHIALAEALEGIMRGEMGEAGEGGHLPWRGPQKGHA